MVCYLTILDFALTIWNIKDQKLYGLTNTLEYNTSEGRVCLKTTKILEKVQLRCHDLWATLPRQIFPVRYPQETSSNKNFQSISADLNFLHYLFLDRLPRSQNILQLNTSTMNKSQHACLSALNLQTAHHYPHIARVLSLSLYFSICDSNDATPSTAAIRFHGDSIPVAAFETHL